MDYFGLYDNMHDKSFRKVYHPIVTMSKSSITFQKTSMFSYFWALILHKCMLHSVSSPAEDKVDFPCEDSESSAVEEKKEVNHKPPCFINSYWFNVLCSKLQCYSETSGNQTADQYRMEEDSLNSKQVQASIDPDRLIDGNGQKLRQRWRTVPENVGHLS